MVSNLFITLFGKTAQAKLLSFFLEHEGNPFSITDLVFRTTCSLVTIHRDLPILTKYGLLKIVDTKYVFSLDSNKTCQSLYAFYWLLLKENAEK